MSENTEAVVAESAGATPDIWASLRQAREALGLSVGDVSAHLKLTVRQIDAIERGDLTALPGAAFARGFVRNYARFLGLDQTLFVQAMESGSAVGGDVLAGQMSPGGLGTMPFKGSGSFASLPMALGVFALLVLLSLGAYFKWFESRDEDLLARLQPDVSSTEASGVVQTTVTAPTVVSGSADSVPSVAATASAPSASGLSVPSSDAQSQPQVAASSPSASVARAAPAKQSEPLASVSAVAQPATGGGLKMVFEGDSWVEVRDATGKSLLSKLNPAGTNQVLQGTPPFSLIVGNAGKVKLSWRGKDVDLKPYTKVDVARLSLQ